MPSWANDEGTVLVTTYPDGRVTISLRPEPDAVWGPPVRVSRTWLARVLATDPRPSK